MAQDAVPREPSMRALWAWIGGLLTVALLVVMAVVVIGPSAPKGYEYTRDGRLITERQAEIDETADSFRAICGYKPQDFPELCR